MDPSLPVKNFDLDVRIRGGENYDYAPGVVTAHNVAVGNDEVHMQWSFLSLESGVPVGVTLPSENSFDSVILTMIGRSWLVFILFFAAVVGLSLHFERRLMRHESYLIAATYAFFFVLLPYLAAYTHFYTTYVLSILSIGALMYVHLVRIFSTAARLHVAGLLLALLFLPTLAVILQNYTGLIYSLEILGGLAFLMLLTTRPAFRSILYQIETFVQPKETSNAQ